MVQHISAILLMPLLLLLTLVFVAVKTRASARRGRVAAGFIMAFMPFLAWWIAYPSAFQQTAGAMGWRTPNQAATISGLSQALDVRRHRRPVTCSSLPGVPVSHRRHVFAVLTRNAQACCRWRRRC